MATTVEQLYTQILGRQPDAEGLAFWKSAFGNSVDLAEQASFMQSVQSVLASAPPEQKAVLAPNLAATTAIPPSVTNEQILEFLKTPNLTDAQIVAAMQEANVSPAQVAQAVGLPVEEVATRYVTEQILGQGTLDKWSGEGKGSARANAADMAKIIVSTGATDINQFGQITKEIPVTTTDENGNVYETGETQTVTTYGNKLTGQEVPVTYGERQTGNAFGGTFDGKGNTGYRVEFDAQGKPLFYTTGASSSDVPSWVKPALILGGAYFGLDAAGLLGGLGGSAAAGLTAAEAAGLGLTAAEAASLGLSAAEFAAASVGPGLLTTAQLAQLDLALGGAGGTAGAETLAAAQATGATVPTIGSLTGGSGLLTSAPITAESVAAKLAADAALFPTTAIPTITTPSTGLPPTGVTPAGATPTGGLPASITTPLVKAGVTTAVNSLFGGGTNLGNILNTGLTTGAGLLQQQTSREAAQRAQAMIDAETAAAKASAAFRPVGMTTRFGTSQFGFDPKTGQLTSAGYTLSPEAKTQQDRFMALSNAGLTQAEAAQQQFAPLQTGAQNLFNLGNQYIAQSPQDVAQNYLNQQMALLQPGRELELANLQNRLQQQGRGGLAVAQGGAYGATTPELQALYNARAQQEAVLAAQAQQAGQQQVAFGAGLLGTGAQTMGQYYGGQQAAYAPYTTAMGQVQNLEALGQQPFQMGAQLGTTASTAGARAGALGLEGANISQRLATGAAATTNPYSTALGGVASNPAFGQLLGGLFSNVPPTTALSAPATSFGAGSYYGNQDLGLYL
jgi:hypothetical protein